MTYAVAHSAIRLRFETVWAALTPAQMPNVKFTIPTSGSWVRLNIVDSGADRASMGDPGNNIERNLGQVTVQVFAPSGDGEGEANELADAVRDIFRDWQDSASGLRFRVPPYARQIGAEGKWYQVNVVAPFEFDDFN